MACSSVKLLLSLFNFFLALAGLSFLVLGLAMVCLKRSSFYEVIHDKNVVTELSLIAVGLSLFGLAFFGSCGLLIKSRYMIGVYAAFLVLLLVVQVVTAIMLYKYPTVIEDMSEKGLEIVYSKYKKTTHYNEIDLIQEVFQCCGSTDTDTPWEGWGKSKYPKSCFRGNTTTVHPKGCIPTIKALIKDHLPVFKKVTVAVAVFEMFALVSILTLF